jgi:large subunit ribosomal protein L4
VTPAKTASSTSLTLERRAADGSVLGTVELDETIFGVTVNVPLIHQVVTAQLAARRSGTQNTKTRAEVAGGAAKPFRQKGTGNARQGTNRAPHFSGGGVALGPRPRKYDQKTPKKMIRAALRCALSDRANEGGLRLVDSFGLQAPKTKSAIAVLDAIGAEGRVLVVLSRDDDATARSLSNLPHVVALPGDQLTAFDVLCADVIVFTDETLPGGSANGASADLVEEPDAKPAKAVAAPAKPARAAKAASVATEPAEADAAATEPAETETAATESIATDSAATESTETESTEAGSPETESTETEKEDDK